MSAKVDVLFFLIKFIWLISILYDSTCSIKVCLDLRLSSLMGVFQFFLEKNVFVIKEYFGFIIIHG
jgi:hypothetical protein